MRFVSIYGNSVDKAVLLSDYNSGILYKNICLGKSYFYFKSLFTKYYISYDEIKCAFKRIKVLPHKNGTLQVDYLVLSDGTKELAEIQFAGRKVAADVMDELKRRCTNASFHCPNGNQNTTEDNQDS